MKKENLVMLISTIVALAIVVGIVFWVRSNNNKPGQYDQFAQCLTENNVTYYGAFWCPNCQQQTKSFGKSKKFVNYVECSTPSRGQKEVCVDAGINAYPTWEFADGSRVEGLQELSSLAEASGCQLPA